MRRYWICQLLYFLQPRHKQGNYIKSDLLRSEPFHCFKLFCFATQPAFNNNNNNKKEYTYANLRTNAYWLWQYHRKCWCFNINVEPRLLCVCSNGGMMYCFPLGTFVWFPSNCERGRRSVGWERMAETGEDRLRAMTDEWQRLNWVKAPSGLRCRKQGGNLNQGPTLIESLLRAR